MACCIVTLNDVVSLKLLKSKHIYNFYRIKKEEEENHRNKKEITTKFDEALHICMGTIGTCLQPEKKEKVKYLTMRNTLYYENKVILS